MKTHRMLSRKYLESHPAEAALTLERYRPGTVADLLRDMAPDALAGVLGACLPVWAAEYLTRLGTDLASRALEKLDAQTAAGILRHLSRDRLQEVLNALPENAANAYRRLLSYPEGTVGALMDPFVFVLPEDITIAEAMKRVRRQEQAVFYFPYVVDREQKLVGIITVRNLMTAGPQERLAEVMHREVMQLRADATGQQLSRLAGWRAYQTLPVVEESGKLLGVIDSDALRQLEASAISTHAELNLADGLMAIGDLYLRCGGALIGQMAEMVDAVWEKAARREAGGAD